MPLEFTTKDVIWVIDTTLLEGTQSANLPDVARKLGHEVITLGGRPSSYNLNNLPHRVVLNVIDGPIVAYGCHQFINKVRQQRWLPGCYPNRNSEVINLSPISYMSKLGKEDCLNSDYVTVPIIELIRNPSFFYKIFKANQLFIKDTKTFKKFGGKVLTEDKLADYLNLYKDVEMIDEDSLVLVSTPKNIFSEHRFVVVNNEIIAHSTYIIKGVLDVRRDVWPQALSYAKSIAQKINPCGVWTLDIAMVGDTLETSVPKVLEINSFSCAGLYACDLESIVQAVSKRALDDYILELNYHP